MTPIGVDLGTTNIVAAWVDAAGESRVLYGENGESLIPSTVLFESANVVQVGRDPLRDGPLQPDSFAIQTKRWLGRPRSFLFHGREYSAVELASLMLRKVVARAKEQLQDEVGPVTLAIPAHFDVAQRSALHQVAKLAEVELHGIVSEPVAASLAFGADKGSDLIHDLGDGIPTLVIDMGGGTMDISLVICTPNVIDVPVVTGDAHLGGMDFDRAVYYRLCHHVLDEVGIDPAEVPEFRYRLLALARWGKENLTFNDDVTIKIPTDWLQGANCPPLVLTREEAETLWEPALSRAEDVVVRALSECQEQGINPQRLVFSGGGSLVPSFRERMLDNLSHLSADMDPLLGPDEAVAVGAALYGRLTSPVNKDSPVVAPTLHEHLPYDLGVADDVGHLVVVVPKGTRLPGDGVHVFTTVEDDQDQVVFRIVRRDADGQVTLLGELRLDNLPKQSQGTPDLNVRFQVDAQGALSITAWEGDRRPVSLKVSFSGDLTALRPARRGKQLIVL